MCCTGGVPGTAPTYPQHSWDRWLCTSIVQHTDCCCLVLPCPEWWELAKSRASYVEAPALGCPAECVLPSPARRYMPVRDWRCQCGQGNLLRKRGWCRAAPGWPCSFQSCHPTATQAWLSELWQPTAGTGAAQGRGLGQGMGMSGVPASACGCVCVLGVVALVGQWGMRCHVWAPGQWHVVLI